MEPVEQTSAPRTPESHTTQGAAWDGVPLVDLDAMRAGTESERRACCDALCDAFERLGFVRLLGHGVSPELLDRVDDAFRHFFDLDDESRLACAGIAGGQRGYTPFGVEHAKDRTRPDLKAFYHVGQPKPLGPESHAVPPNVFPRELPELEGAALELYAMLEDAAALVLEGLESGLDLLAGSLVDMIRGGNSILRALDYPALSSAEFTAEVRADGLPDGRVIRAAAHEDINLVTLLPASPEPGLEILTGPREGRPPCWQPVRTRRGEIVADVGDMLARLTGGRLHATTHRVVVDRPTATRRRTAFPFFAHPRPECDLAVRPAFLSPGMPAPWPPITAGAFLAERLAEIGLLPGD